MTSSTSPPTAHPAAEPLGGIDTAGGWELNTLTLWDNRCTQHHAVWDYYPQSL